MYTAKFKDFLKSAKGRPVIYRPMVHTNERLRFLEGEQHYVEHRYIIVDVVCKDFCFRYPVK